MIEHEISTWLKNNGTWDVTHKAMHGKWSQYLYDIERDFKNFPTREEADEYAQKLFRRFTRKGSRVKLYSPTGFGKETPDGCWTGAEHIKPQIFKISENGKVMESRLDNKDIIVNGVAV